MLKKRIIPCLDIRDNRTVKGVNFLNIRDAGDPVELARKYIEHGADELVFLDITATLEKRKTLAGLAERISKEINIPFTVGGGISSVEDAGTIIKAGADKISLNSSAVKNPELITEIAKEYGNQFVALAIDAKLVKEKWKVFVSGGTKPTEINAIEWAKKAEKMGAGEILLTSMNNDGTKSGFALDITARISEEVNIPVIASGGAGKPEHFKDLFEKTKASAALAAGIFHFNEYGIRELKEYLNENNINVREF